MSDLGFELEEISRLIKLVEQRGLSELIVEEGDRRVVIRGVGYQRKQSAPAAPVSAAAAPAVGTVDVSGGSHELPPDEAEEENTIPVVSPMVGVFYRSPSPDAAPYVEVGDRVEVGQIIGMIEAMKVFSEVPSDHAGRVSALAAENGQLVRTNDPLLYLIPDIP